jgi:2-hydroxychromene-2-carboxylate isomerase
MSLERKSRSLILNAAFNPRAINLKRWLTEKQRKIAGRAHVVSVFLQIDDPYSYVLSNYLPSLAAHYDIELRLYLSQARGEEYQPAPDMLAQYSIDDCVRLANELGIPFLDKGGLPPTEHRIGLSDVVAALVDQDMFQDELFQALAVYWRGDSAAAAQLSVVSQSERSSDGVIAAAQKIQQNLGHYSSAMLHYAGEWYWGVDRLHYLTDRLDQAGVARSDKPDPALASIEQAMQVSLPVRPPSAASELPPIELFYSFRSPYSYIALQRTFEIADAFGIEVKVRPVLPMVMRGMKVPKPKLKYIAADTFREAERRKLPFGKISDPVGLGVERCLAVYQYAVSEHRTREFLCSAGTAIWAEAIDVATDKGMRKVTDRSGLFWPDVEAAMKRDDWREQADDNRETMMDSGSWGVPTIRMGDFVVWGQDRDWLLVRHIEELCDTGDGILV